MFEINLYNKDSAEYEPYWIFKDVVSWKLTGNFLVLYCTDNITVIPDSQFITCTIKEVKDKPF